jgi:hypothetical protein
VAKKPIAVTAPRDLVVAALKTGTYPQALDHARRYARTTPGADSTELLGQAFLGAADHAAKQNNLDYARNLLTEASRLLIQPENWPTRLVDAFTQAGLIPEALQWLAKLPDPGDRKAKIMAQAADLSFIHGTKGKAALPADLHPAHDAIRKAFEQSAAGNDEAARQTLQAIGMNSPFLEWKLLLRGLLAWYADDDARAIENWQRLDPQRLPARLIAPLRSGCDASYRTAQAPATQALLQSQLERLIGDTNLEPLRKVQQAIAQENLSAALKLVEVVVNPSKQRQPQLVARLARLFQGLIIQHGKPADVAVYQRIFGTPPHDPTLNRMRALACELRNAIPEAHHYWRQFEQALAAAPQAWPNGTDKIARALVLERMADNASHYSEEDDLFNRFPFFRLAGVERPKRPALVPSPETCLQQAIALTPDRVDGHSALLKYYSEINHTEAALRTGRTLLKHFPEHLDTLTLLADLTLQVGSVDESVEYARRAVQINPLDRELREQLFVAQRIQGRQLTKAGQFDAARAIFAATLQDPDRPTAVLVRCHWAACELKAKNPTKAEELVTAALEQPEGHPLLVYWCLVSDGVELGIPLAPRRHWDQGFNTALNSPPSGRGTPGVLQLIQYHRRQSPPYRGFKTHEKKVIDFLAKSAAVIADEQHLARVCSLLASVGEVKALRKAALAGLERFRDDPTLPILYVTSFMMDEKDRTSPYRLLPYVKQAEANLKKLADDDPRKPDLKVQLRELQKFVEDANPLMSMFGFGRPDDADE